MTKRKMTNEFEEIKKAQKKRELGPDYDKYEQAWENIRKGKTPLPMENDMGPLPTPQPMPQPMPQPQAAPGPAPAMKKGGKVKKMASGGKVRGCGCETKGKTKGRFV